MISYLHKNWYYDTLYSESYMCGNCHNRDITQQGFEGCILEVYLGSTRRSLDDNIMASGILPGCVQVSVDVRLIAVE